MSTNACPCGSASDYAACCGRFHGGGMLPATPEALMRSRYSAFALGIEAYLRATWHPGTAPEGPITDPDTVWLGLQILEAPLPAAEAKRGIVEFEARYRHDRGIEVMRERSRFVRQSGRWWYLDGVHA